MTIHDITVRLDDPRIPIWPGESKLALHRTKQIEVNGANVTDLSLGAHTGTHLDAPLHVMADGASMDSLPLETLCGSCLVIDLSTCSFDNNLIQPRHIESQLDEVKRASRVLFKTTNSALLYQAFTAEYVSLSEEAAKLLVEQSVRLVGIDYISIEAKGAGKRGAPVHKTLLNANCAILEGVDLTHIQAGGYDLACLPLRIGAIEASPVRAILYEKK